MTSLVAVPPRSLISRRRAAATLSAGIAARFCWARRAVMTSLASTRSTQAEGPTWASSNRAGATGSRLRAAPLLLPLPVLAPVGHTGAGASAGFSNHQAGRG